MVIWLYGLPAAPCVARQEGFMVKWSESQIVRQFRILGFDLFFHSPSSALQGLDGVSILYLVSYTCYSFINGPF